MMYQQRRKRKTHLEVQEAPEVVEVICEESSVNTSYGKHKKPDELKMSTLPSFRRSSMPSLAVSGGTAKSPSREPGHWGGSGFSATKSFVPNLGQSSLPLPQPAYNTRAHSNPAATVVIENSDDEDQSSEPPLTPGTTAIKNILSAGDNYYMSSLNDFGSSPPPLNKTRDLLDVVEAPPSPSNRSEGSGREIPRPLAKIFRPRPAVSQSSPVPSIFTESIPSPATVQSSPLSTFSSSTCTHLVDYGDSSADDFESVPTERHPKQASDNTSDGDLVRRPLHNNNNAQTFYPSSCMRNSNSGTWLNTRKPPTALPSYNIKRRSNRPILLNKHKDTVTAAEATSSILSTHTPPPAREVRTRQAKRKMAAQGHSAEDPVLCVSDDDEEEVLETVKKPAATTNKKDREAEIDDYRPPSASKVSKRSTRATISKTPSY